MPYEYAFQPGYGLGVTLTATTTSSRAACGMGSTAVAVTNLGTVGVYIRTGDVTAVATAADFLVLPSQQVRLTKSPGDTHIAALAISGSQSVHAIQGQGF